MPELVEQLPATEAVGKELAPDALAALRPGDLRLILALLDDPPTLRQAAELAGVSESTAARRSKSAAFQRALWEARKVYLREYARIRAGQRSEAAPVPGQ
jgi:hypothetical protein